MSCSKRSGNPQIQLIYKITPRDSKKRNNKVVLGNRLVTITKSQEVLLPAIVQI